MNDDETTEDSYIWSYNLIHLTPEVLTALCDADTLTDSDICDIHWLDHELVWKYMKNYISPYN